MWIILSVMGLACHLYVFTDRIHTFAENIYSFTVLIFKAGICTWESTLGWDRNKESIK